MKLHDLVVEVRDKSLARVGMIPPELLNLTARQEASNVGQWSLTLPSEHELADALAIPGSGIIVSLVSTGKLLFSGPTTSIEYKGGIDDPRGAVVFAGVSDDIVLWDRLAYPQPSNDNGATQTVSHDKRTGVAETLMHAFVNANAGPLAPVSRRVSGLTMGTDGARGQTITKSARFPVLGDLIREIASTSNLGFRVCYVNGGLRFDTYQYTDRSNEVRLDFYNATLESHELAVSPPGATQVIIAGQGELVDRQFLVANSADSLAAETEWGRRIERFVDQRQTDDTNEHTARATEILTEEGFTAINVRAIAGDDLTMQYGKDWFLGDTVAVVANDIEHKSVVTGFALRVNKGGARLGALLGDPVEFDGRASRDAHLRSVERRLAYLERADRGAPAASPTFTGIVKVGKAGTASTEIYNNSISSKDSAGNTAPTTIIGAVHTNASQSSANNSLARKDYVDNLIAQLNSRIDNLDATQIKITPTGTHRSSSGSNTVAEDSRWIWDNRNTP